MISDKQKQIIKLLLSNKDGFNVNQIARNLNISVSWVHETLKNLERDQILNSTRIANSVFFKVNWTNEKARKICEFIILDSPQDFKQKQESVEEISNKKNIVENPTPTYNSRIETQNVKYNATNSNAYVPSAPQQINPYQQSQQSAGFNYSPVGEAGVNNVLSAYANSGAFSGSAYGSKSGDYYGRSVPQGSLGSIVSSNVSGFTIAQHTTQHSQQTSGCRYCGPGPQI
jgi:DNA-binding Lrp family transcriptional regulator